MKFCFALFCVSYRCLTYFILVVFLFWLAMKRCFGLVFGFGLLQLNCWRKLELGFPFWAASAPHDCNWFGQIKLSHSFFESQCHHSQSIQLYIMHVKELFNLSEILSSNLDREENFIENVILNRFYSMWSKFSRSFNINF